MEAIHGRTLQTYEALVFGEQHGNTCIDFADSQRNKHDGVGGCQLLVLCLLLITVRCFRPRDVT